MSLWLTVIFALFILFAYHNLKWFPEKERHTFVIKLYYPSGRVVTKSFNLPKSTKFSLVGNKHSSPSLRYYNSKPFGREYGYLVIGIEDYEVVDVIKN